MIWKNAEGYDDPTAGQAIMNIMREKRKKRTINFGGRNMTAKEYMNRAYRLDQRINSKMEQLQQLKSLSQRVTATYGTETVAHSRNVDTMANAVIKIAEAENELNKQVERLVCVRKEIRETIDLVADPDCRMLLELRYLCMKQWSEISSRLELGRTRLYTLHMTALKMVETVLATKEREGHAE